MNYTEKKAISNNSMTLREFRNLLSIPQKVFAPAIGVSQSTYSRMENEEKLYSPEELEKLYEKLKKETIFQFITNRGGNKMFEIATDEHEIDKIKNEILEIKYMIKKLLNLLEEKQFWVAENNHPGDVI